MSSSSKRKRSPPINFITQEAIPKEKQYIRKNLEVRVNEEGSVKFVSVPDRVYNATALKTAMQNHGIYFFPDNRKPISNKQKKDIILVSNLGRKRFLRYKKEEKKVEKLQRKLQIYSRQLNKSRELHKRIEDTLVRKIEKIQKEIDEVLVKYGEIEKNLSRL
jgi:hypothetical protein